MSGSQPLFKDYVNVVKILREHFGDQDKALFSDEEPFRYAYTTEIKSLISIKNDLKSSVAEVLLTAEFTILLTVRVYGDELKSNLRLKGNKRILVFSFDKDNSEKLRDLIKRPSSKQLPDIDEEGLVEKPYKEIVEIFKEFDNDGNIGLSLDLSLNKTDSINDMLIAGDQAKVISFLFPEALITCLQTISLKDFEEEFFQEGRRTIIPIFGYSGYAESDFLAICGKGHESKLDELLTKPIPAEVLKKNSDTVNFQQSEGRWINPTTWLTPDTFAFKMDLAGEDDTVTAELRRQLKSFQALLSAIFLADNVETIDKDKDKYRVEYKGFGRVRLPVERTSLLKYESHLETLFNLYTYAYEGFSPDKLEIAQQFLSLIAIDLEALCSKANEVSEMTKTAYGKVLVGNVKDYFDARFKIQERLKTAVAETSNNLINLSRDVSADLYKIAGVIAGAVVGALLKPELSLWATLAASVVIAIYLSLVIFYYLATLQRTYDLRMGQHKDYINSFKNDLRSEEIERFLGDDNLGRIQEMFLDRFHWAATIYLIFLMISVLAAAYTVFNLF